MANKDPEGRARTKKRIVDAYWALVSDETPSRITASAVIARAEVNRSTFYDYFGNVEDVSCAFEDEIIDLLARRAAEVAIEPDRPLGFEETYSILDSQGDRLRYLIGGNGSARFMAEIKRIIKPMMVSVLPEGMDVAEKDYRAEFAASGLLATYALWHSDQRATLEDISTWVRDMVFNCLDAQSL